MIEAKSVTGLRLLEGAVGSNCLRQSPSFRADDFQNYSLVIDARAPREYEEDHIPGSVNLPVVDDAQFAEVGTLHTSNPHKAYLLGAQYSLGNIASHLASRISHYGRDARFLVYCFRGGKRSRVWADTLRNIGYRTDVLHGGWKAYRAWVRSGLDVGPSAFRYRVISGLTGCGKTLLLAALRDRGEQTLDLEGMAAHRGSLIGAFPNRSQPSQKSFDSELFAQLRALDPSKPVWVEAESKKIGRIQIPPSLHQAISTSPTIELLSSVRARVNLLKLSYPNFVHEPTSMVQQLAPLKALVGGEEYKCWQLLAGEANVDALFERVLVTHYDPSYTRSARRQSNSNVQIAWDPTDSSEVASTASALAQLTDDQFKRPESA